jgi:hypothetical protein
MCFASVFFILFLNPVYILCESSNKLCLSWRYGTRGCSYCARLDGNVTVWSLVQESGEGGDFASVFKISIMIAENIAAVLQF